MAENLPPVPPLFFRKARMTDLPALLQLTRECVASMRAAGNPQWDDSYPNAEVISKDIAAQTLEVLCDGSHAENAAAPLIGCITVDRFMHPLWAGLDWRFPPDSAAAVHRLMISPSHRGQGLAKLAMAYAEALATTWGCRSMRLDCFCQNKPGHALYPGLGYRFSGIAIMRVGEYSGFEKALE